MVSSIENGGSSGKKSKADAKRGNENATSRSTAKTNLASFDEIRSNSEGKVLHQSESDHKLLNTNTSQTSTDTSTNTVSTESTQESSLCASSMSSMKEIIKAQTKTTKSSTTTTKSTVSSSTTSTLNSEESSKVTVNSTGNVDKQIEQVRARQLLNDIVNGVDIQKIVLNSSEEKAKSTESVKIVDKTRKEMVKMSNNVDASCIVINGNHSPNEPKVNGHCEEHYANIRRHEMIIRENTPIELPPDVVRRKYLLLRRKVG